MEELLTKLYKRIAEVLQENLKIKELFFLSDNKTIDVFKTLMFLNNKNLNKHLLDSAISIDELKYHNHEALKECFDNNYVIKGNGINSDKAFISVNGIYEFYSINNWDFRNGLVAYDKNNFVQEKKLIINSQEKIWCIFLILFGADNIENSFDSEALPSEKLTNYHKFFITIEKEMEKNGVSFGKKVGWSSGKNTNFRSFITNHDHLSKTSIHLKKGKYQHYLDLSKKKNTKYLLDLILDKYEGEQRIMINDLFYDALRELSYRMPIELGEMNEDINKHIIEELKG
jgi:hypothetical protein